MYWIPKVADDQPNLITLSARNWKAWFAFYYLLLTKRNYTHTVIITPKQTLPSINTTDCKYVFTLHDKITENKHNSLKINLYLIFLKTFFVFPLSVYGLSKNDLKFDVNLQWRPWHKSSLCNIDKENPISRVICLIYIMQSSNRYILRGATLGMKLNFSRFQKVYASNLIGRVNELSNT